MRRRGAGGGLTSGVKMSLRGLMVGPGCIRRPWPGSSFSVRPSFPVTSLRRVERRTAVGRLRAMVGHHA